MANQSLYECADVFMARVSLLPADVHVFHENSSILNQFLQSKAFLEAVAIASPSLYKAIKKISQDHDSNKQSQKIYFGMLKYFLRISSRATPFGAFSFIWPGTFSESSSLDFNFDSVGKRTRMDAVWMQSLIDLYHRDPAIVRNLHVMANPNARQESGKLILSRISSGNKFEDISIRNTSVAEQIIRIARRPVLYSALENQLCTAYPGHDANKIKSCLWQFFEKGFLLSELSICPDKPFCLKEFVHHVEQISIDSSNDAIKETNVILKELSYCFQAYEEKPFGEGIPSIEKIFDMVSNWKSVEYPVHVDSYCKQGTAALNKNMKGLFEEIADILFLFSHERFKTSPLSQYHKQFLEKYGTSRLVPVIELISPVKGLGLPSRSGEKNESESRISKLLMSKLNANAEMEIVVDDCFVRELKKSSEEKTAPLSTELFFEVAAESIEELDEGNYTILLNPSMASNQAGSTFGRFLYLWDDEKKELLRELLKKEEALLPHTVFVEASFTPLGIRTANVCFHENVRDNHLKLHYCSDSNVSMDLEDIYVGANGDCLYLYSEKLKKELKVCLSTAVNPELAPPVLKLLLNISGQRYRSFYSYVFEEYKQTLFLPRLRYKNAIICPARWHFSNDNLRISKDAAPWQVAQILLQTFKTYNVPDACFLSEFDNRLLVHWSQPDQFKLILDQMVSKKEIFLFEHLNAQNGKTVRSDKGCHVSEFVIPFVKRASSVNAQAQDYPPVHHVPFQDRHKFPGNSNWLYAKIFVPSECENEFISFHLKKFVEFIQSNQWISHWFYIRYFEDRPQIRLRLQGQPETLNSHVMPHLSQWCSKLVGMGMASDFSFHCYEREVERYGGPALIELAEAIFSKDSNFSTLILERVQKNSMTLQPECLQL